MDSVRRRLRAFAWLAFAAMAAFALLPTVGRALAHASAGYVEVCTPAGIQFVAIADGSGPAGDAGHHEPCPFCGSAFGALLPPPAPPAVAVLRPPTDAPAPVVATAPPAPDAWASIQPRAPPALA